MLSGYAPRLAATVVPIHTDAIKAHLIPAKITAEQARLTYASEADVLNMALFGQTAKQWRDVHPGIEGNMRDEADVTQLLVLANLESLNAEFIHMGLSQSERLLKLNQNAIRQLQSLTAHLNNSSAQLTLGKGQILIKKR